MGSGVSSQSVSLLPGTPLIVPCGLQSVDCDRR